MRVVEINAVCGSGSTGRICTDIADALKESGDQVKIIYGNQNSTYPESVRVGSQISLKANALFARISGLNGYFALRETKKIIKIIKDFSPDIVHLHNLHANYVNVPKLLNFLSENNIATVVTLHDCWFFTGKCTHYISSGCKKWENGCRGCPRLKQDIPSLFFDRTEKMWLDKKNGFEKLKNLGVIGVSDWITNEAKKSFLKNAKIIKRIYNWIDLEIFNTKPQNNVNKNEKFTVFVASAGWENGSERFNDLLKLAKKIPDNMQIVAAGNFEDSATLPSNIAKVGYISDSKIMANYYRNSDVYVHLSRADTFGKVIAEALACGTPAVVYNSTACPEIVGDGCGYVVNCGDINSILKYCLKIQKNGKEFYSEKCRLFAKSRFDKKVLTEETLDLYKELLK